MNTLPLELHSQIFELACIDDGSTARSLSLVSRYVRSVVEPFLYQSLAVAGLSSMTELLARLKQEPRHKRRVRRLFLSDWTRKQVEQRSVPASDEDMDRYDLEKATIIHLLDLVAPTLQSLTVLVSCPFNSTQLIGHLFSLKFPHLRALTIHGFYPFPHVPDVMPAVECLHLSGNRNPYGLLQSGALDAACPNLVHVRVSGLVSASSFAEELAEAVLPASHPQKISPFMSRLPKNVSHIVVHPGPPPAKTRRYSTSLVQHEKMGERFKDLAQGTGSKPNVRFTLLEKNEDEVIYDMLRHEWAEDATFGRAHWTLV